MKRTVAPLLLAFSVLTLPGFAQKVGDAVTPDALAKGEWIRGEAPAAWEPGKLYLLECWASWCGPCLTTIPHIDALYDKYRERGLRVIGVNVWEDGKDKVAAFVEQKGEGMSYPIVYIGKDGVFEKEWLKPAQVLGIPTAFVVKDGKVLFTAHPSELSEPLIESLLAGGDAEKEAVAKIFEARRKMAELSKALKAFRSASAQQDTDAMSAAIDEVRKGDPESRYLAMMEIELLLVRQDWSGASSRIDALPKDTSRLMTLFNLSRPLLASTAEGALGPVKQVATQLQEGLPNNSGPIEFQIVARLFWKAGEQESAIAAAERSVEIVRSAEPANGLPLAPFQRFAETLKKGEMPSEADFNDWLRDALRAKPAN